MSQMQCGQAPSTEPLCRLRPHPKNPIELRAARYVPQESISANKSDIPLIATPQSVSVITRDQIDLLNFVDAQQAVRRCAMPPAHTARITDRTCATTS